MSCGDLRQMISRVGPTWQQAESELAVRVGTSQRAALASQMRVASYFGRGPSFLPLPADIPHCASYTTHYERIFAGDPSPEARELATLLPLRYVELRDASAAVTRAEEWVDSVARSDADGTGTLRSLELLALRRRAFVQIARDYNRRIARYSELATPGQVSAGRLTGMLIKSTASATATRPASPAPPMNRQSNSEPPRTFAEGATVTPPVATSVGRDDSVEQTSAMQPVAPAQESSVRKEDPSDQQERSILVKPQG